MTGRLEKAAATHANGGCCSQPRLPGTTDLRVRSPWSAAFDFVYLNTELTTIINLQDHSYSAVPGLVYNGYENTEQRLRMALNGGGEHTEFGGKPIAQRLELRVRYFF